MLLKIKFHIQIKQLFRGTINETETNPRMRIKWSEPQSLPSSLRQIWKLEVLTFTTTPPLALPKKGRTATFKAAQCRCLWKLVNKFCPPLSSVQLRRPWPWIPGCFATCVITLFSWIQPHSCLTYLAKGAKPNRYLAEEKDRKIFKSQCSLALER